MLYKLKPWEKDKIINNNSIFAIALRETIQRKEQPNNKTIYRTLNFYNKKKNIDNILGEAAVRLSSKIGANCIVSLEKLKKDFNKNEDSEEIDVKVSVFKGDNFGFKKLEYTTSIKKNLLGSISPVKELLAEAISKKHIRNGDRVVCVQDESLGTGYKGLIFVFDVDKLFFNISSYKLAKNTNPEVVQAIINIALEIGREGREGKRIGTAFIIGDQQELSKYSKQLILNPFNGYPESMRKITDPALKETVKNFAQLDGVFIIDNSGTIVSAGTYLDVNTNINEFRYMSGFGTRHRCAASITKLTNSIAVVVSESGGVVRIFKNGRIILTLS